MNDLRDAPFWPPTGCEAFQMWLNARLDGECTPAQEGVLVEHLSNCLDCAREWAALERTRLAFSTARLREPSDLERQALARLLAPRLLNGAGWALIAGGAALLSGYGAWELWHADDTPDAIRIGMSAVLAGVVMLLGRLGWERWRLRRVDPYREVMR
ncbi:MAG TPA: zf-HC2 domain-containing protein [Planctomycetota bacterium]